MVLFLTYYTKYYKSKIHEESIHEALNKTIGLLNSSEQLPTYCSGIAGVGWMLMHLKEKGWIDIETEIFFKDIDDYLHLSLISDLKKDNYDFLHGYLGILYYFIERLKCNLSQRSEDLIYKVIQNVFTHISEKAIRCEEGVKWETRVSRSSNVMGYNLGLAHGIPSIVSMLGKLPSKLNQTDIKGLILSGINYLNSTKFDSNNSSLFSNFIKADGVNSGTSRLGWCYGDLGIGLTFLNAGKSINSLDFENKAFNIFNHSLVRKEMQGNGIRDACFCHGTSGISHIYNRIYQKTGLLKYKDIAVYWNQKTIDLLKGPNGYKTWFGSLGWQNEYNILEGISGIGLSLLSSINNKEPEWDKCFLIS
jgi:hypothetical protein